MDDYRSGLMLQYLRMSRLSFKHRPFFDMLRRVAVFWPVLRCAILLPLCFPHAAFYNSETTIEST